MAHSIQTWRGNTEVLNDLDLILIIGFAVNIVRQVPQFEELQSLVSQWQNLLRDYGPGIVDLHLEQLEQDPEKVRKLRELLAAILVHASQYHQTIPAGVLNELLPVAGIKFRDYSVACIEESIKKLQALIIRK